MDPIASVLSDPARAGVYHLDRDPRTIAQAATEAGLAAFRIDIGHAHDKEDFLEDLKEALNFPDSVGSQWDALAGALNDLSWIPGKGYVVILEKSKHFCASHRHEFEEAINTLKEASTHWKSKGKPFWALVAGPEGWQSGYPVMPAP